MADTKTRVTVIIDGKEYTVVGDESESYIKNIAKKVDDTINAVAKLTVSSSMKLVLAALNIADEAEKNNAEISELKQLIAILEEKNKILQDNLNNMRLSGAKPGVNNSYHEERR